MTQYGKIESWVKKALKEARLAPGDALPSESELSKMLSVSRNSVRTALANLANEGIVETKKGIGTFVRAMGAGQHGSIGFICMFSNQYIFPGMVQACSQVLTRNGYHLLLGQSEYDLLKEREAIERMRKKGVDGLIIEPYYAGDGASNVDLLRDMEMNGTPVVLIDNHFQGEAFSAVILDDREAGKLAAEHLHDHGHRRIAIVHDRKYFPKTLRVRGAEEALAARGSPVPGAWVLGYDGPFRSEKVQAVARDFLASLGAANRPTAFLCTNDEEAIEIIRVCHGLGLVVPRDISIMSFDNSSLSDLPTLGLTSIDHPGPYMGDMATSILLEKIRYPEVRSDNRVVIRPRIVQRDSVSTLPV